jgi:rhodanese-related sulfurtransferase/DNA-directed RNA polymerase subunit RPC12/RpoP
MKRLIGLFMLVFFAGSGILFIHAGPKDEYQCLPCGNDCDNLVYDAPGTCPHCQMPLVEKSTVHFKNIQPDEICRYIAAHPNAVLLDVRTREEFEGKANPDFGTLKNAIKYKKKEIIVYCSHSHRSPTASYILTQHGFAHVTNMLGGMSVLSDSSCRK